MWFIICPVCGLLFVLFVVLLFVLFVVYSSSCLLFIWFVLVSCWSCVLLVVSLVDDNQLRKSNSIRQTHPV